MSIQAVPNEILQQIFRYLSAQELIMCGNVCLRWKQVTEDPRLWKSLCLKDHGICEKVYTKASLSWRELYTSLSRWTWLELKNAVTKTHILPDVNTGKFYVLQNSTLAIPMMCSLDRNYNDRWNTIVYYNIKNLKEKRRQTFDFYFKCYAENDNIIVLVVEKETLCIIPKRVRGPMKHFYVGQIQLNSCKERNEFVMLENEVYFKNTDQKLCHCRVSHNDGRVSVETETLCSLEEDIIDIAVISPVQVNIFTTKGFIFTLKDKELKKLCVIGEKPRRTWRKNVDILSTYGFKWSSQPIFNYLSEIRYYDYINDWSRTIKYKYSTVYTHGKVLIFGTSSGLLYVYSAAYDPSQGLGRKEAIRAFILEMLFKKDSIIKNKNKIGQIDIVETINGHKIIVLYCHTVCVIELVHEPPESTCKRRKTN